MLRSTSTLGRLGGGVLASLLLLASVPQLAQAQYFGRNKVQYTDFKWQILKTEHFDIYYYPEMEEIVKQATGCSKVVVFDHTIRVDDEATQTDRKVRGPVKNVHNDFTRNSAPQRVKDLLPADEAEARLQKRFGSINIWRPIVGPVETAPLAICGWDTLDEKNLIPAERRYNDRIGGVLHLCHNPDQRWFYFPRMEREEVVLLKCFDSLEDGTAKWTCHGSFKDPNSPANAKPRQSIEIRTLYFFDD